MLGSYQRWMRESSRQAVEKAQQARRAVHHAAHAVERRVTCPDTSIVGAQGYTTRWTCPHCGWSTRSDD